eukprot:6201574-Pleurochrysis_carterae.AAC.2
MARASARAAARGGTARRCSERTTNIDRRTERRRGGRMEGGQEGLRLPGGKQRPRMAVARAGRAGVDSHAGERVSPAFADGGACRLRQHAPPDATAVGFCIGSTHPTVLEATMCTSAHITAPGG